MRVFKLRLYEDNLSSGCPPVFLPGKPRALYTVEGALTIESTIDAQRIPAGAASICQHGVTLINEQVPTRLWRWELALAASPPATSLPGAPSTQSTLKLEAEVNLDTGFDWLMRCDEVGFPPGGIALTHVHQGPGIRICAEGEITIQTQGTCHRYTPGAAWFESGPEPVLAPTTEHKPTRFVRCFLLPRPLKGRSSIRYVLAEDIDMPKAQTYRVFAERNIDLPQ